MCSHKPQLLVVSRAYICAETSHHGARMTKQCTRFCNKAGGRLAVGMHKAQNLACMQASPEPLCSAQFASCRLVQLKQRPLKPASRTQACEHSMTRLPGCQSSVLGASLDAQHAGHSCICGTTRYCRTSGSQQDSDLWQLPHRGSSGLPDPWRSAPPCTLLSEPAVLSCSMHIPCKGQPSLSANRLGLQSTHLN